ncbi:MULTISPECIES: class I SAM-dependent methyltransferase [Bacillaceae]|uniref:class I SAM-dependent methyltransferase n=1 Tax=Bacillaceae TaxID=186817 RepID=UPI0004E15BDB|nr:MULTISPECIES: class I SAM-dependent methyltransferase [Bacillaceae]MCF2649271.1 methyltransferase domain-containing protein [Niallia circulans]CAI9386957.1 Ubiquinone biosynthesis O-methyltransferase, mitochondrial [Bacillus sp. T2.9-1]
MTDILQQNKKSWDIVAHHFNGIDALPSYGPFCQTEEELRLFKEIKNKKVLDIGCGSGHSLLYMADKGASELWGVDLSEKQIETAKETLKDMPSQLYCAAMEKDIALPKEYFDIVYSIYAIGWTTDLATTFNLIYSYLKPGGAFIFSWDHPLYAYMQSENGQISLTGSYQEEGITTYPRFKGEEAPVVIPKRKMSTYINELIKAGFTIECVMESEVSKNFEKVEEEISDRYYSLYKARKFPTTMIIKARRA